MRIVCARCKRRHHCRFRQPGTWVVDCELFEEDAWSAIGAGPRRRAEPERAKAGEPVAVGAGARRSDR